jgi:hypothetical protein
MSNRTISDLWRTFRSFLRTAGGFEGKEISKPSNPDAGYRRIYPKTDGWYDLDDEGVETLLGSGGCAGTIAVSQAGHSFVAGNAVYRKSDSTFALAKADVDATSEVCGVVESADGNDFVLIESGLITGLSGGTDGAVGYLSAVTAGVITTTEPDKNLYVSRVILTYTSTTTAIVNIQSGFRYGAVLTTPGSLGSLIVGADAKNTPIDADELVIADSADSNIAKKLSWAYVKSVLKTYFDGIYTTVAAVPGVTILSGTQGTRPAAGTAGRIYLPTDGYYPSYDTGAVWVPQTQMGSSISVANPPAYTAFTKLTGGAPDGATLVADGDGLLFTQMGVADANTHSAAYLIGTVPVGAYTWVVGFELIAQTYLNYRQMGLVLMAGNDTNADYVNFAYQCNTTGLPTIAMAKWTAINTYSAAYTTLSGAPISTRLWFKWQDDTVNRIASVSTDGRNWKVIHTVGRTDFITPTYCGLYSQPSATSLSVTTVGIQAKIFHWTLG